MIAGPNIRFSREEASRWSLRGARLSFAVCLVLLPFQLRFVLVSRPVPSIYSDYTDFLLFAADVAVAVLLTLWVASFVFRPRRLNLGPRAIWNPLVGLTLTGFATTVTSLDPVLSVYHAIRFVALFWFYVFVVNEIHEINWILIPVSIQLIIQSIVALAQFLTQQSIGLSWLGIPSLDPARLGISVVVSGSTRLLRAYGLTAHPNILGGCLAFGMLLLIPFYLRTDRKWLVLAALLPAGAALLVSFSRSAWLALASGCALIFVLDLVGRGGVPVRRWLLLTAGLLAVTLPIFVAYQPFFGVRLGAGKSFSSLTAENQSIGERVLLLDSEASMIAGHPWLGVGLGAAPLALKLYHPDWAVNFEPPHAALVDAALEVGLPAAGFYLALILSPFIIYFARRRVLLGEPFATAALAVLLGITVVGFFDYYTWMLTAGRLWQWFAWGVCALAFRAGQSLSPRSYNANLTSADRDLHVDPIT